MIFQPWCELKLVKWRNLPVEMSVKVLVQPGHAEVKVFTLNSPKLRSPGSWKEPHLLKLIPERKKLRVKAADMEQKSCRGKEVLTQALQDNQLLQGDK